MYRNLVFFALERNAFGVPFCGTIVIPGKESLEYFTIEDACSAVADMERSGELRADEAEYLRNGIVRSDLPADGRGLLARLRISGVNPEIIALASVVRSVSSRTPAVAPVPSVSRSGGDDDCCPVYDRTGRIV